MIEKDKKKKKKKRVDRAISCPTATWMNYHIRLCDMGGLNHVERLDHPSSSFLLLFLRLWLNHGGCFDLNHTVLYPLEYRTGA